MGLSIATIAATYFLPTGAQPMTGLDLDASLMAEQIASATGADH
jgi:hypothetical protein